VVDAGVTPTIISIDFVGGANTGPTGTVVMTDTEVAGVKPVAHWNSAASNTGGPSSLLLADGTTSSASVAWKAPVSTATNETSATWTLSWTDSPGNVRMMNGYLDPRTTATPATVTVTGLPSPMSSGYDVYVYCYMSMYPGSGTRTAEYTIGSTTHTVAQTAPSDSAFSAFTQVTSEGGSGNYIVFRNVTGASFTLTATPGTTTGSEHRAPVNGIQIVYPSGS
jgi:hypothetical protein